MNYPAEFIDYCTGMDSRLTSLRKCVLFILWQSVKPLKAYEILNELLDVKLNSTPPTVYRVLDYFVNCGVVHKIESIQSYTLCHDPKKHLPSEILMVCNHCHHVCEVDDNPMRHLAQCLSQKNDFYLGQDAIELKGLCHSCHALLHP